MYDAIKDGKVEFIELYLEKGFSLKNFLTKRLLLQLFNNVIFSYSKPSQRAESMRNGLIAIVSHS